VRIVRYSAAELLGAGCAPAEANVELTVPGGDFREQPGLSIHRDLLAGDEILDCGGVPVTTALRTAWDLARWLPTVEAVVAMDSLAGVGRFDPTAVLRIQSRYPRARWRRRVPGVIDLSDPKAESPMETRSRLVLVLRGLPRPELQYEVYTELGEFVARLDMAYPWLKLAIEYDGRGHLTAWQQQSDARRLNKLHACGWSVLRFTSPDILHTPDATAAPSPRRHRAPFAALGVVNSTPTDVLGVRNVRAVEFTTNQIGRRRKMGRGRWRRADMT